MSKVVTVSAALVVPQVPNFLFFADEAEGKLPLSAIRDESLREIGEAWTEELLKRAKEQREHER